MRVNLENCIANSGAAPEYRAALENLVTNLKELRDRTGAGDLAALSEFFEIYRFNDSEQAPQLNTIAIRPRPIIDPGEVEEVALLAHFRTRPCVMVVLAGHLAERGALGGEAMAPAPEGEDQAGWDQIATISNVDLDHPEVCKDVAEQLRQLAEELGGDGGMNRAERHERAARRKKEIQEGMLSVMGRAAKEIPHETDEIWHLAWQAANLYLDEQCRRHPQEAALIRAAGREQEQRLLAGITAWMEEVRAGLDRMDRERAVEGGAVRG